MRNWIMILLLAFCFQGLSADFVSPTARLVKAVSIEQIKHSLKAKHTGFEYRELFDKAIAVEQSGFMGYYGGSIDDLIYQDIIRVAVEEIAGIPIRKDFHFLSVPLNNHATFDDLTKLFLEVPYKAQKVAEMTFPLNFALYANHNRTGLNSVVNFTHNRSATPKGSLKRLFVELGIDAAVVETLYAIAHQHLESKAGVLLQLFDTSASPYAFANTQSYAAYPNGYIAENRLISEYFLDDTLHDFPQEVRLLLNLRGVLNPSAPIAIKRYTKIQPSKLKAWEQDLREVLRSVSVDPEKQEAWSQTLKEAWR